MTEAVLESDLEADFENGPVAVVVVIESVVGGAVLVEPAGAVAVVRQIELGLRAELGKP